MVDRGGRPSPTGVGGDPGEGEGAGERSLPPQVAPETYASLARKRSHTRLKRNSIEAWLERDQDVRIVIDNDFMGKMMEKINVKTCWKPLATRPTLLEST